MNTTCLGGAVQENFFKYSANRNKEIKIVPGEHNKYHKDTLKAYNDGMKFLFSK